MTGAAVFFADGLRRLAEMIAVAFDLMMDANGGEFWSIDRRRVADQWVIRKSSDVAIRASKVDCRRRADRLAVAVGSITVVDTRSKSRTDAHLSLWLAELRVRGVRYVWSTLSSSHIKARRMRNEILELTPTSEFSVAPDVSPCCGVGTTFHDAILCCKSCWQEVGAVAA